VPAVSKEVMTFKQFCSKGGKAGTGAAKARKVTTEQARKAALARWAKAKGKK
jgi:hypothetical protein